MTEAFQPPTFVSSYHNSFALIEKASQLVFVSARHCFQMQPPLIDDGPSLQSSTPSCLLALLKLRESGSVLLRGCGSCRHGHHQQFIFRHCLLVWVLLAII
ncbi:hypothetical protein LINGRAHAP2_LOCUS10732 [Linum grandiflorum]